MEYDFPEIITLSSIGKSFQKRDIDLMTVDARDHLIKKYYNPVLA